MPTLPFSKWSPGGNTTLLFPSNGLAPALQCRMARQALTESCLGGEQAGFVDIEAHSLRMAGGEFCINASRAVGAMLAYTDDCSQHAEDAARPRENGVLPVAPDGPALQRSYTISVSGWQSPVQLRVCGYAPHWRVEVVLQLPDITIQRMAEGIHLVRLPGISHLLLDGHIHSQPEDCYAAAALLRERYDLKQEAAVGVIWWRTLQGQMDMLPLVHVRDTRSDYLESACGSGALALALSRSQTAGGKSFTIMQPSGSPLDVRLFSEGGEFMAGVDGPVSLVAKGQVWLPDAAD
ncbi:MAG: hypothetical protein BCS36_01340 [Desulfovibrio sp. MES5]|uniref:hypothetical protein n=1 Tax=Desulfovibrio sp. MES5 TaxID=1899016 RepID=UPI000B9CF42C|nr:hypothetical protein [Desulfovibrio sp. MES5]OXS29096.1 MAG: hypothetical protein BCS36_01340 [Desulfovibrio sp. MES5]